MSGPSSTDTRAIAPLQRALQMVVIPDLVSRRAHAPPKSTHVLPVSEQNLLSLANACLDSSHAVEAQLEALLAQGCSMDQLYLEVIANTARLLGRWWTSDKLDFANLTLGVERLQAIVRHWDERFQRSGQPLPGANRCAVLLLSEFNDQHSLGVLMLQAFFKRDGWRVHNTWGMEEAHLLRHLRSHVVHLIGLSVCTDRSLGRIKRLIQNIRQCSLNPEIQVMLGGPLLLAQPEMAQDLGADWLSGHADRASQEAYERVVVRSDTHRNH